MTLTPADVLALLARLAFVILLYVFVAAVLLSLRRTLQATSSGAEEGALTVSRAPRGVLKLADGAAEDGPLGRIVPLDRPITIGRRPDCDLTLRDDAVSGHHARIAWDGSAWVLEDLGSRNGTYVNGERASEPVPLQAGDAIRMGNGTWRVELRAA